MHFTSSANGPQAEIQAGQSNTLRARNYVDAAGNPSSGYVHGPGLCVVFQDGPRGKNADGQLQPSNGAFVEDLLLAAFERLSFFQGSQFRCDANAEAMLHIDQAISALHARAKERQARGVLGSNAT